MDEELKDVRAQIAVIRQRLVDMPDSLRTESAELREQLLKLQKQEHRILKEQIANFLKPL